ncbi:amino acid ABC transporter permease [Limnohabitans sp. 2KL-1]|uniref:amino acid ABC transporter permease n=1 Tax=Limnohabitans sp. 2KL-1 TaxID=1100699 RepID=UPI001E32D7C6|nr:ABC transporter permease subunit [Limnohabitans sp. 2KL-1]
MSHFSMIEARPLPGKKSRSISWRSREGRSVIYQIVAILSAVALVGLLVRNTLTNMRLRGIQSGYDFLLQPFGFDISETLIAYEPNSTYLVAFAIGMLNTLKVALIGIALATLVGVLVGVGRFSANFLVRKICYGYVEFFRNVPVYLQLLIWYLVFTETLPDFDKAWQAGHFYLSKNGLSFPWPVWQTGQMLALFGVVLGVAFGLFYRRRARAHFDLTGQVRPVWGVTLGVTLALAVLGWLAGGAPSQWNLPKVGDFQIEDGGVFSPEFMALLCGLVFYTAAFIAEVVRSGIASVSLGQHEAAASLGLNKTQSMRLVVLPQALRVIIPPLTSQYLNLTKNSSLAVAIGYPELVSIANTTLNQTGRAIEALSIVMLVYLTLSLITSALMNWLNASAAIQER